jgi:hypothetical protein
MIHKKGMQHRFPRLVEVAATTGTVLAPTLHRWLNFALAVDDSTPADGGSTLIVAVLAEDTDKSLDPGFRFGQKISCKFL